MPGYTPLRKRSGTRGPWDLWLVRRGGRFEVESCRFSPVLGPESVSLRPLLRRLRGHGDLSQSLAERLLELESSEEEEIRICSVDLETGCVHRLQQATQLTEALVEILPGGRRALLCGDFEERQQARCLLELLPKANKRPSIIFESSLCISLHIFAYLCISLG